MAERPILFNTEMVRAILEGRKTQTRRLVKGLPLAEPWFTVEDGKPHMCDEKGDWYPAERFSRIQPGDILWVRETWHGLKTGNERFGHHKTFWYRADDKDENPDDKWRPSIHMPREAARLFLRVKAVRMERLQDITPQEIMAEGLDVLGMTRQATFRAWIELWNSTVKKGDLCRYGWNADPWVWVIEFERRRRE